MPKTVAIIGGGPAGLRAAEVAAAAGAIVTLYDGKRSVGRKFLVAGKSGLNLTNAAEFPDFLAVYSGSDLPAALWRGCLENFNRDAMRAWAAGLGIETVDTSSGKIFPSSMKAAPLLRRWIERLRHAGVRFQTNHRWIGLAPGGPLEPRFLHDGIEVRAHADAVVLALGGGSWPETGSDGSWVSILRGLGVEIVPLSASNCGWECSWSAETIARIEGRPLQNIHARAGGELAIGEALLTRYGIQGTVVYALGRALRSMPAPELRVDFKPTFTVEQLARKMESVRRNFLAEAPVRWKLPEAACAVLEQMHGPFSSVEGLARATKDCRIPLIGPRPLTEAISTAGGVSWHELDEHLMLRKCPGVYCAGEMIDWDAPTGGYLLQACFATGTLAGESAAGHNIS